MNNKTASKKWSYAPFLGVKIIFNNKMIYQEKFRKSEIACKLCKSVLRNYEDWNIIYL